MTSATGVALRIAFWGLALCVLSVVVTGVPGKAAADVITSQTQQILPPGGTSCVPISAGDFTPYVYDNALNSFDFTVPDASYVAVGGSVAGTPIPIQYMTRRISPSGILRVHVDIQSTPVKNGLPIEVTLLSSHASPAVTCLSVVTMGVGEGSGQAMVPIQTPTVPSTASSAPRPSNDSGSAHATGSSGPSTSTQKGGTSTTKTAGTLAGLPFMGACGTTQGTYRLWLILLGLYVLLVAALFWEKWPSSWSWVRAPEWRVAAILLPLVLLLGFWYFFAVCRSAWWIPLALVAIAAIGSFASFRNESNVNQLLLLDSNNKNS